jgi:nitroreductase
MKRRRSSETGGPDASAHGRAVTSRREVREYSDRAIPDDAVLRILEAGRISGSSKNRQPWRFLVVEDPQLRERIAESVYAPDNVRGAALVIAIAVSGKGPTSFDAGRAAQNMMLTAWNDGIGACPNGIADAEAIGNGARARRGRAAP